MKLNQVQFSISQEFFFISCPIFPPPPSLSHLQSFLFYVLFILSVQRITPEIPGIFFRVSIRLYMNGGRVVSYRTFYSQVDGFCSFFGFFSTKNETRNHHHVQKRQVLFKKMKQKIYPFIKRSVRNDPRPVIYRRVETPKKIP